MLNKKVKNRKQLTDLEDLSHKIVDYKEKHVRCKASPSVQHKYLGGAFTVAADMVSPIVLGVLLGIATDKALGYKFAFKIFFFILGVIVGCRSVYKIWKAH